MDWITFDNLIGRSLGLLRSREISGSEPPLGLRVFRPLGERGGGMRNQILSGMARSVRSRRVYDPSITNRDAEEENETVEAMN